VEDENRAEVGHVKEPASEVAAASEAAALLAKRKAEAEAERRTAAPLTVTDAADLEAGIVARIRKEFGAAKSAAAPAAKAAKTGVGVVVLVAVVVLVVGAAVVAAVLRTKGA